MKKVIKSTTDSFRERGSKFIGYLFPVESVEAFENELDSLKSKYPDATHHCYAWRINPIQIEEFAQDDGEPGGTAGLPILNCLKSYDVVNAAAVVVRYYGGTNLGKSGLIEAYSRAAELCLSKARLAEIQLVDKIAVAYPYSEQNAIDQLKHRFQLQELKADYEEKVRILFACPVEKGEELIDNLEKLEHRGIEKELVEKGFI